MFFPVFSDKFNKLQKSCTNRKSYGLKTLEVEWFLELEWNHIYITLRKLKTYSTIPIAPSTSTSPIPVSSSPSLSLSPSTSAFFRVHNYPAVLEEVYRLYQSPGSTGNALQYVNFSF